jgi:ferredoxin-NADP reductase
MHRYAARVSATRDLSPTVLELTLKRPDGSAFPYFLPGQYATLSFPANKVLRAERSFSIASAPTTPTSLSFGIRIGGRYTKELRALKPGDDARVALPFGRFTFDPSADKRVLLIAGGIGVTPFISMIRTATAERLPNSITLLYSVRSKEDMPYRAELDALDRANPNFRYAIAVSIGPIPDSPYFTSGYINAELIAGALEGHADEFSFFLCGPPPFMAAMVNALKRNNVAQHRIRTERFSAGSADIIERRTLVPWLTIASWGLATAAIVGVIFKAEQAKRSQTTLPTAPVTTNAVVTPTNTAMVPTNAAATPTPTPTNTTAAPVVAPTPVVTQPTPQPVYQAPVQPRTRLS